MGGGSMCVVVCVWGGGAVVRGRMGNEGEVAGAAAGGLQANLPLPCRASPCHPPACQPTPPSLPPVDTRWALTSAWAA